MKNQGFIILANSKVIKAIPSHLDIVVSLTGKTREQLCTERPKGRYFMEWMCEMVGCIACYSEFHIGEATTEKQAAVLDYLIKEGLTK